MSCYVHYTDTLPSDIYSILLSVTLNSRTYKIKEHLRSIGIYQRESNKRIKRNSHLKLNLSFPLDTGHWKQRVVVKKGKQMGKMKRFIGWLKDKNYSKEKDQGQHVKVKDIWHTNLKNH